MLGNIVGPGPLQLAAGVVPLTQERDAAHGATAILGWLLVDPCAPLLKGSPEGKPVCDAQVHAAGAQQVVERAVRSATVALGASSADCLWAAQVSVVQCRFSGVCPRLHDLWVGEWVGRRVGELMGGCATQSVS